MSTVFGLEDGVRYPFLDSVKQQIKNASLPLDMLGNDQTPLFLDIVDLAMKRIMFAITGKKEFEEPEYYNDKYILKWVFSFVVALFILKIVNFQYFTRRFALTEAKRSEKFLISDAANSEKHTFVKQMLHEQFNVDVQIGPDSCIMSAPDYIKHTIQFNDLSWKMVNRTVHNGDVYLPREDLIRLLRQDIMNLILKKVNDAPSVSLYDANGKCKFANFEPAVLQLREVSKKYNFVQYNTTTDLPPCIEDAVKVLEEGQNLSNSGRFMLATFMHSRGMSDGDIADLYRNAPDFNKRITEYHVSRISQLDYKCPGCQKLMAQGLCRKTSDCDGIINPMQFRGKKK